MVAVSGKNLQVDFNVCSGIVYLVHSVCGSDQLCQERKSGWICKNSFFASIFYHICNCKLSVDVSLYGQKWIYQCISEGLWTERRKVSGIYFSGNGLHWINLGYNIILFLSAIKDIPYSYYEAAKLDGANSWQTFWKITFPLLKPTSVFVLITSVIASFQCLDLIMVMTGGGPAKSTEVASLYIYKQSFEMMKAGYGAGLSVVMFLILTVLAVIMLKINGKEE